MQEIQLREAKATLSAVVDNAQRGEATVITRHGRKDAVVIGFAEWERLSNVPSFGLMLMSAPIDADNMPERHSGGLRDVDL